MRPALLTAFCASVIVLAAPSSAPAQTGETDVEQKTLTELVALERAALDRWIRGDPGGYLELCAPEVTYFDPTTDRRVDGLAALEARFAPMKDMKLPIAEPRYEMTGQKVQRRGDVALLTFNLVNYGKMPGRAEQVLARWNATQVYARIDGKWRIIHSHWSIEKPGIKPPGQ